MRKNNYKIKLTPREHGGGADSPITPWKIIILVK